MGKTIQVGELADAVMKELDEYADTTAENVKKAVKSAGTTVKKEINANAPKDTGIYAKSWRIKQVKETANSLAVTVYSPNRYQIAHLLEHGHAKRGGGRVAAKPHIAKAEEIGVSQMTEEIERGIRNG